MQKALTDGMAESLGVPKNKVVIKSIKEVSAATGGLGRRLLGYASRLLTTTGIDPATLTIVFGVQVDTEAAAVQMSTQVEAAGFISGLKM